MSKFDKAEPFILLGILGLAGAFLWAKATRKLGDPLLLKAGKNYRASFILDPPGASEGVKDAIIKLGASNIKFGVGEGSGSFDLTPSEDMTFRVNTMTKIGNTELTFANVVEVG